MSKNKKLSHLLIAGTALFAGFPGCGSSPEPASPTMIVLSPVFDDAWGLTQVELLSGEHQALWPDPPRPMRSGEDIRIVVTNPAETGKPMPIAVWGLRGKDRVAHGEVEVTPRAGTTVHGNVTLTRLPCGDWCTPGARECVGEAVRECYLVQSTGCTAWGPLGACPAEAPFCSLGQCAEDCVDECQQGASKCLGSAALQRCGQTDQDPCLDWLPPEPCEDNATCDAGTCTDGSACHDECDPDERRCDGNAVTLCGHHDPDDCLDWGPPLACPEGQSCSAGVCTPLDQCEDECTQGVCSGDHHRPCGQFDLDPCQDFGTPTSCISQDACLVASCDVLLGCGTAPLDCSSPPASRCVGDDALEVFAPTGVCQEGSCSYASNMMDCPNCPHCDPCAGVVCNEKTPCFAPVGTCSNGYCHYDFANGEACKDDDPCTVEDRCADGACVGKPLVCDDPPAGECIHAGLVRTYAGQGTCTAGQCAYGATEVACPNGCVSGACGCVQESVTVSASGAGLHGSVVADPVHGVHVAFSQAGSSGLQVAHRALDGTWAVESVANHVADTSSLAIDPTGVLHVAYVNASKRLAHAWRVAPGTWTTEVVDSNTGQTLPSLAVDPNGALHVAYANTGGWLNYARKPAGGSWQVDSYVNSDGEEFSDVSLAVSAQGTVHVSYVARHEPPLAIEYETLDYLFKVSGGNWQHKTVVSDLTTVMGHYTSIVPRPDGGALIAYRDAAIGVRVARVTANGGVTLNSATPAGVAPSQGRFVRLARDPAGSLVLVYASGPTVWTMRSTDPDGAGWLPRASLAQVGEATGCGLTVDGDGAAHVTFQDAGPGALLYVRDCP